jgi:hypothetical protein
MIDTSADATSLSPWWRHSAILVMIAGFSVLSIVTVLTYTNAPPIPEQAVDGTGAVVFTGADIQMGQEVFLKYGLMEHGSLWGHGAYLGPDYSAEYLHRLSEVTRTRSRPRSTANSLRSSRRTSGASYPRGRSRCLRKTGTNQPRELSGSRQARWLPTAHSFPNGASTSPGRTPLPGCQPTIFRNPGELKALTAYFAWAAWATTANRPGKDYSYTNNWPYEPIAGNRPSTEAYVWSALSLITLLSGAGFDPLRRRQVRLLGLEGRGRCLPYDALRSPCFEAHAQPVGYGMVLRHRGPPVPGAIISGRRARPLSGGAGSLLRVRHRPLAALQPGAHLAPPTRHLLDRDGLGGRRPFPGVVGRWRGAQTPEGPASTHSSGRWWWSSSAAWQASPSASTTSWGSSGSGSVTRVPSTWTSGGSGSSCWQLASSSGCF